MTKIIGIDLGTTNSEAAYMEGGTPRIIPTAAALAYGLDKKGEGKIAVLDLGGGTFDVTLMEMGEGVFEVIATSGDTQLGGMDMDNAIIQWLAAEFRNEHGVDISGDKQAMQRLRDAGEKAKIELTSATETTTNLQ